MFMVSSKKAWQATAVSIGVVDFNVSPFVIFWDNMYVPNEDEVS